MGWYIAAGLIGLVLGLAIGADLWRSAAITWRSLPPDVRRDLLWDRVEKTLREKWGIEG